MATSLTSIFGDEIIVSSQPRAADRQFSGFAGAHGMTSMLMGSRGYQITVRGVLRASGEGYSGARGAVDSLVQTIEDQLFEAAADYSFQGRTYSDVVFNQIQLIPDSRGQIYKYTSDGQVMVSFICTGRTLY